MPLKVLQTHTGVGKPAYLISHVRFRMFSNQGVIKPHQTKSLIIMTTFLTDPTNRHTGNILAVRFISRHITFSYNINVPIFPLLCAIATVLLTAHVKPLVGKIFHGISIVVLHIAGFPKSLSASAVDTFSVRL